MMKLTTTRGYNFSEVTSALQKAIRRADARLAGYWAIELFESGYVDYLWRRLLTISAEDCSGVITKEIAALESGCQAIRKNNGGKKANAGRIFAAKAVLLLCAARKSRDSDYLTNYVYDKCVGVSETDIEKDLAANRMAAEPIPDYAFDCHTSKGKRMGKTKEDFFREEFQGLQPKQTGFFDTEQMSLL